MGINATTLRKAEELEEKQKREFLIKRAARIRNQLHSIDYNNGSEIDKEQSFIDKILRKLGLQRIR